MDECAQSQSLAARVSILEVIIRGGQERAAVRDDLIRDLQERIAEQDELLAELVKAEEIIKRAAPRYRDRGTGPQVIPFVLGDSLAHPETA